MRRDLEYVWQYLRYDLEFSVAEMVTSLLGTMATAFATAGLAGATYGLFLCGEVAGGVFMLLGALMFGMLSSMVLLISTEGDTFGWLDRFWKMTTAPYMALTFSPFLSGASHHAGYSPCGQLVVELNNKTRTRRVSRAFYNRHLKPIFEPQAFPAPVIAPKKPKAPKDLKF